MVKRVRALALWPLTRRYSPPSALVGVVGTDSSRLRALHSAHPGYCVAWISVGAAAFGVLFALTLL
jgi:hypothetical protein